MTSLLTVDLRSVVPGPEAHPELNDFLKKVHLNSGRPEIDRWQPVDVHIKDDRESPPGLTDFILTVPFQMVSRRLADLLRTFKCECEYLPVIAHYRGRKIEDEFFALNALHIVREALDVERSNIGFYDQEFRLAEEVKTLVLKEDALADAPLSYLREISSFAVNETLSHAIDEAGLVGIKLMKPEEFRS